MAKRIYTDEHLDWLREHARGKFVLDVLDEFNTHFGLQLTYAKLRALMHNHGINNGMQHKVRKKSVYRLTTPDIDRDILAAFHQKGTGSYISVQAYLQNKYGISLSLPQVKSYASRIKLNMGVNGWFKNGHVPVNKGKNLSSETYAKCKKTMFKKGNKPSNWKPVGSERVAVTGYIEVKVKEPNVWKLKHRILYEQATGETLKDTDKIVFLDGNPLNITIENLAKITNADLARLNQMQLRNGEIETGRCAVLLAQLTTAVHKRK